MRSGGFGLRLTSGHSGRGETGQAPSQLCVVVAIEFPVFSTPSMVKFPS